MQTIKFFEICGGVCAEYFVKNCYFYECDTDRMGWIRLKLVICDNIVYSLSFQITEWRVYLLIHTFGRKNPA